MVKLLLKPGKSLYSGLLKTALISAGISCLSVTSVLAEGPNEGSTVGLRKGSFMALQPPPSGTELFMPDTTLLHGLRKMDLRVSGTVRFLTIYRDMSQYYADMQNAPKNIAFTEYSSLGGGTSNTGGVPNLELLLSSKYGNNANFNVGYSFLHSFTGSTSPSASSAKLTAVNNLWFSGNINTKNVRFGMSAGSILWTNISRFTMGQPIYRDNYFYRQPWDWYRQSFTRWEEYYSLTSNVGTQGNGNSPLSGFVGTADLYKIGLSFTGLFGRTNRTVAYGLGTTNFPAYVTGGRIQKAIFTKSLDGRFGLNYYRKDAYTDRVNNLKDVQEIISLDGRVKWRKIIFSSELATGLVNNPMSDNKRGYGFFIKADADKRVSKIPIGIEYYNISYNLASLDGGILNSNKSVHDGGYPTEYIYDNMQMINIAQEVGQVANNRQGIFLNGEAQIERFKVQLGMGISQELNNTSDTVTIQHRVNALARSRFRPWFNAGGPYSRIKSGWQRTFETITITDVNNDYKKGFNNIELLLKYKFYFLGMDMVVLNFHNFNSIQDKLSPIPIFSNSNSVFVRQYFTDLTLAYRLSKKVSLSVYGGIEKLWGSDRVDQVYGKGQKLIYDNSQDAVAGSVIKDANGKIVHSDLGLNINQTGWGLGAGIDYDFTSTASLHLRHTRMSQKDKNFLFDRFKGSETNLELKIFF